MMTDDEHAMIAAINAARASRGIHALVALSLIHISEPTRPY